jgi:hypothetical protein
MGTPTDTGDVAEVPVDQREDRDGYHPDDYGGPPILATDSK